MARSDTLETRLKIINAAEKLFAQKGIDEVTLFDINQSANQANRNALQYHFKNKQGLLKAVLDKHAEDVMGNREKRLEVLRKSVDYTLRDIIFALVQPLIDKLNDPNGGVEYIDITAQLMVNPNYLEERFSRNKALRENLGLNKMMNQFIPKASKKTEEYRTILVESLLYHSLAAFITRNTGDKGSLPNTRSQKAFSNILTDGIVAVIHS